MIKDRLTRIERLATAHHATVEYAKEFVEGRLDKVWYDGELGKITFDNGYAVAISVKGVGAPTYMVDDADIYRKVKHYELAFKNDSILSIVYLTPGGIAIQTEELSYRDVLCAFEDIDVYAEGVHSFTSNREEWLETKDLILRPFHPGDELAITTYLTSHPDVTKYTVVTPYSELEKAREFIDKHTPFDGTYAMVLKEYQIVIGGISCSKTDVTSTRLATLSITRFGTTIMLRRRSKLSSVGLLTMAHWLSRLRCHRIMHSLSVSSLTKILWLLVGLTISPDVERRRRRS